MDWLNDLENWLKQDRNKRNLPLEKKAKALPIPLGGQITHEGVPMPLMDKANVSMPLLMQQLNREPAMSPKAPGNGIQNMPWDHIEKGIPKGGLEQMYLQRQGTSWL